MDKVAYSLDLLLQYSFLLRGGVFDDLFLLFEFDLYFQWLYCILLCLFPEIVS
jgi:hypothetical protein